MSTASDDRDDLTVQLDWPVDPLAPTTPSESDEPVARLAPLEAVGEVAPRATDAHEDLAGALEELSDRVDQMAGDLAGALAAIDERMTTMRTALMGVLGSRQTDVVAGVREELNAMSVTLTEALAASRRQGDLFAEKVAGELQALRRRIPVKGKSAASAALDDAAVEELVMRLSDEVEIRVAAALKPKPKPRRKS